jgi:hypothetical protein
MGINWYFQFYNHERPHQSLGYRTPFEVYSEGRSERMRRILTQSSVHLNQARILS